VFSEEIGYMTVRRFGFLALAVIGLAAAVPSAHATPILPNAVTVVPDAGTLSTAAIAGPTTTMMTFQSGTETYNLELTSAVYPEGKLVAGGLTFSWKLKVLGSSNPNGFINALSFQDFSGAALLGGGDVQYVADGGVTPTGAIWSGATVGFSFAAPLLVGTSSAELLFHTKVLAYKTGSALAQGGAQYTSTSFAAAVPEPTTMVLAFVGLPLLGLYGMRRRARA
jgi:hypothetical protein